MYDRTPAHLSLTLSRRGLLAAIAAFSATPAWATSDGAPDILGLPVPDMRRVSRTLWIKSLTTNVWITCFTFEIEGNVIVPANGLIIADRSGATLVDTGCTRDEGEQLLHLARDVTGQRVTRAIATHFHDDRTGGIEAMRAANIPVLAHPYTVGLAQAYGFPIPQPATGLERGPVVIEPVELFFPGPGHTRDNITVWHGESRTLFGGCLLRPTIQNDIAGGTPGDSDLAAYPATLARLAERYPTRQFTIPGHGPIAGDALAWTQHLAQTAAGAPQQP